MKCPCCGQPIPVSSDVIVSLNTNSITLRGVTMRLEPREAEVLYVLAERMPAPLTRETIVAKVWGLSDSEAPAKNVDVHVCKLRQKLGRLGLTISKYREGRNSLSGGYALVDTHRHRAAA
jgi:DNA-binding response OmpR family regulator